MFIRSLVLLLFTSLTFAASALEVGDNAPDFSLAASDGKTYRLADFKGKQAFVIAWFPRAYTSGCTIECKSLAENGELIRAFDVTYFMASVDPLADNIGFAKQQKADFPLLSDPEKEVAKAYGVLSAGGYAKRHTIYVDKQGVVSKIDRSVKPASSAQDMAATLAVLGVAAR
ncbi:MAG: redoxin domain-containing protein [Pseudomonadota bacterium]